MGLRSRAPEDASSGYTATRLRMAKIKATCKPTDSTLNYSSFRITLLSQKGETSSRLFTEAKPCRMRLISGWVTTSALITPTLTALITNHTSPLDNHCMWLEYLTLTVFSGYSAFLPHKKTTHPAGPQETLRLTGPILLAVCLTGMVIM